MHASHSVHIKVKQRTNKRGNSISGSVLKECALSKYYFSNPRDRRRGKKLVTESEEAFEKATLEKSINPKKKKKKKPEKKNLFNISAFSAGKK